MRLQTAMRLYLEHSENDESPDSSDAFLARHRQLGDILRPLVHSPGEPEGEAPDSPERPRIPGYRLLGELGRGGAGIVYEAVHERLGKHVAIKVLSPERRLDARCLARFRREARVGGELDHPAIVSVLNAGTVGGVEYLVQELVPGGRSLDDEIDEGRRRPGLDKEHFDHTARLIRQAAQGAPSRPRGGHRPQGRQAGEPAGDAGWRGSRRRLRARPRRRFPLGLAEPRHDRHAVLHEPRASGLDRRSRCRERRVRAGRDPLRGVGPAPPVRGCDGARGPRPRARRRAPRSTTDPRRPAAGPGRHHPAMPRAPTGRTLRVDGGARRQTSRPSLRENRSPHAHPSPARRLGRWLRHHPVLSTALVAIAAVIATLAVAYSRISQKTTRILELSDEVRVRALIDSAADLWPVHPDVVPRAEAWLAEARALAPRRRVFEQRLEANLADTPPPGRPRPLGLLDRRTAGFAGRQLRAARGRRQWARGGRRESHRPRTTRRRAQPRIDGSTRSVGDRSRRDRDRPALSGARALSAVRATPPGARTRRRVCGSSCTACRAMLRSATWPAS